MLSARQNTNLYENADGYAVVEHGDENLSYHARLPSTILDIIRDECGETACSPSGGLGLLTLVFNSDRANDVSYVGCRICKALSVDSAGVGLVNAAAGTGISMPSIAVDCYRLSRMVISPRPYAGAIRFHLAPRFIVGHCFSLSLSNAQPNA